jgi:hypothetical protein
VLQCSRERSHGPGGMLLRVGAPKMLRKSPRRSVPRRDCLQEIAGSFGTLRGPLPRLICGGGSVAEAGADQPALPTKRLPLAVSLLSSS